MAPERRTFPERAGALRDAVEGRAHPIGVSTAKPRLRSYHDHVQGKHPSLGDQHIAITMYSVDQTKQLSTGCAIGLFGEA